jgi:hypothetical protein
VPEAADVDTDEETLLSLRLTTADVDAVIRLFATVRRGNNFRDTRREARAAQLP